jgi:hypothetical protein
MFSAFGLAFKAVGWVGSTRPHDGFALILDPPYRPDCDNMASIARRDLRRHPNLRCYDGAGCATVRSRYRFGSLALKSRLLALFAVAVCSVGISAPMFAHHGTANYNMRTLITLKGTVTEFEFVNPHVLIHFDIKTDKGVAEHWYAEATSPNRLSRAGWTRHTIKPGDEVTISGYRAKNGATVMRFEKMVLPNGQEINEGGTN